LTDVTGSFGTITTIKRTRKSRVFRMAGHPHVKALRRIRH